MCAMGDRNTTEPSQPKTKTWVIDLTHTAINSYNEGLDNEESDQEISAIAC